MDCVLGLEGSMMKMKVNAKSYYKVSDTECQSKVSQWVTPENVRNLSAES